ncbi:MAG: hypothetical protein ACF8R7_10975 [Phycisphaerales bacterium JB039]
MCNTESPRLRRRIWVRHLTEAVLARQPVVEIQRVCPMCRSKERRGTAVRLAVLLAVIIVGAGIVVAALLLP